MLGGGRRTPMLAVSAALALGLIVWAGVAGLTAAPQQKLPTKAPVSDPKDASPWPDAAALAAAKRAADSRPLFAATEPLVFTLVADFGQVQRDREPDGARTYPAKLIVAQSSQSETSIPVKMGVYDSVPALKPKSVSAAKSYLEEFFRTIERPSAVKKAFIDGCNGRHSIE